MTIKSIRSCIVFCLLLAFSFSASAERDQPKLSHHLSKLPYPVAAPDFKLQDMDEETHRLDDYKGKVIMLNFWATWCPPCRREMPSMERLHKMLDSDRFAVIAINQMETPDHVFAYTGQLEVDPTFTILFDTDSSVSQRYRVNGLPTSYIIDKRGYIRYRAVGGREFDHPAVVKIIKQLIDE